MSKTRLDSLLVERGLAESLSLAQRLIMAGQVRLNGQVTLRAATPIAPDDAVEIVSGPRYVSRGGDKLAAALKAFDVDATGRVCADVGASTGGFTDCLLQAGAARVYAIDVGRGVLDWKLRQDHHVVVMEETNARFVERLPEPVSLVTVDASFISLKILLPVVKGWFPSSPQGERGKGKEGMGIRDNAGLSPYPLSPAPYDESGGSDAHILALIKPQFEVGQRVAARARGVIRDPASHRQVLMDVLEFARLEGYGVCGLIRSPLLGPKGNTEFLAWLVYPAVDAEPVEHWVSVLFPQ